VARFMKVDGSLVPIGPGPMEVDLNEVDFSSLPTSDPEDEGKLWNDAGTVKVSAG